jgi:hypothetical protein
MRLKKNKNMKIKQQIKEICTCHSDGGTSGYLLTEEQFEKIFAIIEQTYKEGYFTGREDLKIEIIADFDKK